jgi:hypothetical protein
MDLNVSGIFVPGSKALLEAINMDTFPEETLFSANSVAVRKWRSWFLATLMRNKLRQ